MSISKLEILRRRILLLFYSFQFQGGIFALMGTVDPESFDTLHSYANAFEMPFVTPWFPESMYSSSPKVCNYILHIKTRFINVEDLLMWCFLNLSFISYRTGNSSLQFK